MGVGALVMWFGPRDWGMSTGMLYWGQGLCRESRLWLGPLPSEGSIKLCIFPRGTMGLQGHRLIYQPG